MSDLVKKKEEIKVVKRITEKKVTDKLLRQVTLTEVEKTLEEQNSKIKYLKIKNKIFDQLSLELDKISKGKRVDKQKLNNLMTISNILR